MSLPWTGKTADCRELSMHMNIKKSWCPEEIHPPGWGVTLILRSFIRALYEFLQGSKIRIKHLKHVSFLLLPQQCKLQVSRLMFVNSGGWSSCSFSLISEFVLRLGTLLFLALDLKDLQSFLLMKRMKCSTTHCKLSSGTCTELDFLDQQIHTFSSLLVEWGKISRNKTTCWGRWSIMHTNLQEMHTPHFLGWESIWWTALHCPYSSGRILQSTRYWMQGFESHGSLFATFLF